MKTKMLFLVSKLLAIYFLEEGTARLRHKAIMKRRSYGLSCQEQLQLQIYICTKFRSHSEHSKLPQPPITQNL
jgi:hypothetical protein